MKQEEILRQEAIRLHLQGESVQSIVARINRSRQWVYKWIARYAENTQGEWYLNESNAPERASNRIDKSVENSILSIRNKLQNQPYAQKGAISIMYEMRHLGLEAPSLPTINRVLSRNNLVSQSSVKTRKNTEYPTFFTNVQQMDLIGPKYLKGGFRFYLFDIIDVETHFAGVYPILNKSAESITPCVIDFLTVLIGLTMGASTQATTFLTGKSLFIFGIGAISFIVATASGILFVKFMNLFLKEGNRINPLIGNAGVSALPDSARVSQEMGLRYDKSNHLLMHAMGPTVASTIGSAVVAGLMLGFLG